MIIDPKTDRSRAGQLEFLMLVLPFVTVFNLVLFCVCIGAIVSLAATGAIFGWAVAGSLPTWASILLWVAACSI